MRTPRWTMRVFLAFMYWTFFLAAGVASVVAWEAFSSGAVWVGLLASLVCLPLYALSCFFESRRKKPAPAW